MLVASFHAAWSQSGGLKTVLRGSATAAFGLQMCFTDGVGPRGQCQVWVEVHVHGVHHRCR